MRPATAGCLVLLLAVALKSVLRVRHLLSSPEVRYNDEQCQLVGGDSIMGSEDMAVGRHGVLFITSGDLFNTFGRGAAAAHPGGRISLTAEN